MGDALRLARLLDELRGGNLGHPAERNAVKKIRATWPEAPEAVSRYDRFASDAAARAVKEGATAVVFGAAGFPGPGDPPHKAAADASPRSARFFYAGANTVIASHRSRALEDDSRALALATSVLDPNALLRAIRGLGAGPGPYMLQFAFAAAFMTAGSCAVALARYRRLLPPGSQVLLAVPDGPGGRRLAMLANAEPHSPTDVMAWAAGAGFVIAGACGAGPSSGGRIVATVARVP